MTWASRLVVLHILVLLPIRCRNLLGASPQTPGIYRFGPNGMAEYTPVNAMEDKATVGTDPEPWQGTPNAVRCVWGPQAHMACPASLGAPGLCCLMPLGHMR